MLPSVVHSTSCLTHLQEDISIPVAKQQESLCSCQFIGVDGLVYKRAPAMMCIRRHVEQVLWQVCKGHLYCNKHHLALCISLPLLCYAQVLDTACSCAINGMTAERTSLTLHMREAENWRIIPASHKAGVRHQSMPESLNSGTAARKDA